MAAPDRQAQATETEWLRALKRREARAWDRLRELAVDPVFGYLYLRLGLHYTGWDAVTAHYQQWRRRRLQQKFRVYMRKQHDDSDPWVN